MEKLKFVFVTKATPDGKSNWIAITSIGTQDDRIFLIPDELQAVAHHETLKSTKVYANIKNTIKKRGQTRSVWVQITDEIKKTYFDDDGNIVFGNQYLEEVNQVQKFNAIDARDPEDPIVKILEKLVENNRNNGQQSVKKVSERFVIEKFDGNNGCADQWMEIFEKECARFNVIEDENKIEIFRLFLEKSCLDWYSSMMIRLTLQSQWAEWKQNFCETYSNKGWSASRYALSFKYQAEYAIKKERLLLGMRKSIDTGTLIDIIAAGLPNFITDKINKEEILEINNLFNEIGKLEYLVNKKKVPEKRYEKKLNMIRKQKCSICEKLRKGVRYHPESSCWFKTRFEENEDRNQIRMVNNSELECELENENQKN